MNCEKCKYWHNCQSELSYSSEYGICINPKHGFNTKTGSNTALIDRLNESRLYMGVHRFESVTEEPPIQVNESRYVFVTVRSFGCIDFEEIKKQSPKP